MEVYDTIFKEYKKYILENSEYNPIVVKHNNNTATQFPVITCQLSNSVDTDFCSLDMIEKYEEYYFTINIYAENKTQGRNIVVASQIIVDELTDLTIKFFGEMLRMKRTLNRATPNIDKAILRQTIQYQCLIGNARGNIIRR